MSLTPGARLGPYTVLSAIGAGGMGEVYRARDTRLNRDVAIKILPDLFAADADRVARFQREAQVLASLNHPHIAQIYGVEDRRRALVLELVDGPTLAERIAQGPLPLDEALPIAKQIAEALEAAHEHGIVHRDLKPANIKLTADGTVKVLDFGLAKASRGRRLRRRLRACRSRPRITSPAMHTHAGIILGTAAYMSPEQARGKAGRQTHRYLGLRLRAVRDAHRQARVRRGRRHRRALENPSTRARLRPSSIARTPASVQKLLRRCLQKDRKRRLADIADARFELDEPVIAASSHPRRLRAASGFR